MMFDWRFDARRAELDNLNAAAAFLAHGVGCLCLTPQAVCCTCRHLKMSVEDVLVRRAWRCFLDDESWIQIGKNVRVECGVETGWSSFGGRRGLSWTPCKDTCGFKHQFSIPTPRFTHDCWRKQQFTATTISKSRRYHVAPNSYFEHSFWADVDPNLIQFAKCIFQQ